MVTADVAVVSGGASVDDGDGEVTVVGPPPPAACEDEQPLDRQRAAKIRAPSAIVRTFQVFAGRRHSPASAHAPVLQPT